MALEFLVRNQRLKLFSGGPVVADSQQYLKARFTFTEDWQGTRKYAQFRRDGEVYTCVIDEYGETEVPWETLVGKGVVQISAFATNQQDEENKLITTNPVFVKVETSGIKETELPKTPSLGILGSHVDESLKEITDTSNQLILQMTEIRDRVLQAENHIDQTDYKIYVGETAPTEDITNAMVWINPAEDDGGSDELAEAVANAQNAANTAEKIATDLGLVDEAVQTAVASAEQASNKADVATAKADIATNKANEASASAATATAKADAASTSATNAAQSYANSDAIATQLTEYLASKESLTAPTVDKTLLIEGAAADSKVVGELSKTSSDRINAKNIEYKYYFATDMYTNTYINASGGLSWTNNATNRATDFIPIEQQKVFIHIEKAWGIQNEISFYNAEKEFISGVKLTENENVDRFFDMPDGTRYIRICNHQELDNAYIVINAKLQKTIQSPMRKVYLKDLLCKHSYIDKDGAPQWNSSWRCSHLIRVDQERIYINVANMSWLNTLGVNIALYDKNKNYIAGYSKEVTDHPELYLNSAKYIRICNVAANIADTDHLLLYRPFFIGNNIVVSKDGKGDYDTITEAVEQAMDGDTIYVKNGIYTEEYIKAWGKALHIIGENKFSTRIISNQCNYENPPIEFSVGILENLTFERTNFGTDAGYVLHVEDDYQYGKSMIVKNCVLKTVTGKALGMGMRGNSNVLFEDVDFVIDNTWMTMFVHDASDPAFKGIYNLEFKRCCFTYLGGVQFCKFTSQEVEGSTVNICFSDCRINNNNALGFTIDAQNYYGSESTNPEDYLGLINWRLSTNSGGNNVDVFNSLPNIVYTK